MKKRVRLSDLARVTHGYAFDGAGFTGEATGNILITPGNFNIGGGFKLDKPKYFRGEVPERFVLKPGDLVVTMTDLSKSMDTLGCAAIIPELTDGSRALHNQRVGKFELISDEVDRGYLAYRLRGHDYLAEVRASSSGSTVHHTSPRRIEQFEFDLPPLAEQRAIAATLGALDDKIESNHRTQKIIEDLVRAIVTKALESSEGVAGSLSDYCSLIKQPVRIEDLQAHKNYISFEHMPKGSITLDKWGKQEGLASEKSSFRAGDILFGKLRPYFKKVGIAPVDGVCSSDILVLRPISPLDTALVAVVASSDSLIDSVSAAATGTRMPRASWRDISRWPLPKLLPEELQSLSTQVSPLIDCLVATTHEQHKLAVLRDTLTPALLKGEVGIEEI